MRLYGYWRSSSSWRVRIALEYKRISYELVPVDLLNQTGAEWRESFVDKNPMAQVPLLEIFESDGPPSESRPRRSDPGGDEVPDSGPTERVIRISQSIAILEYLEELYPDPALLPSEPTERALARQIAETVNAGMQPFQNLRVQAVLKDRGLEPLPFVTEFLTRGFLAVEQVAKGCAGRFLVGDSVTFADVCMVPQLYSARRLGVSLDQYPTLLRCDEACAELESFQRARPEVQPDAR